MVKLNHIHLTFVDAVVKITHLEEILQIFYKVKRKKKPVYVFVHHPSYKDLCKKISLLEFSARKMFASSDELLKLGISCVSPLFGGQESRKTI